MCKACPQTTVCRGPLWGIQEWRCRGQPQPFPAVLLAVRRAGSAQGNTLGRVEVLDHDLLCLQHLDDVSVRLLPAAQETQGVTC